MEASRRVLLIDDDKFLHKAIAKTLGGGYCVVSAYNGREGLTLAKTSAPDIILLDVEMPEMNGYEVCERLRADSATARTPILFMSGHSSLKERLMGLDLGADDYLVKPCTRDDILAKLSALDRYQKRRGALEAQIELAQKAAYTALAGNSEIGRIMLFVEQSYAASSFHVLMTKLLGVTTSFGLNCTAVCKTHEGPLWFALMGEVPPIEREAIEALQSQGRFYDFGARTQINYPCVSLLIKNMPVNDRDRYGRLKDALPVMLGAADAKIRALMTEQAIRESTDELKHSFEIIDSTLQVLGSSLKMNQENGIQIIRRMMNRMTDMLPGMGLEDDQEERLVRLVDGAITEAADVIDNGERFAVAFDEVLRNLDVLLHRQQEMVRNVLADNYAKTAASTPVEASAPPADDGVRSVELF